MHGAASLHALGVLQSAAQHLESAADPDNWDTLSHQPEDRPLQPALSKPGQVGQGALRTWEAVSYTHLLISLQGV